MNKQFFYTITLILVGACLSFFGQFYWSQSVALGNAEAKEQAIAKELDGLENFLKLKPQTNENNK